MTITDIIENHGGVKAPYRKRSFVFSDNKSRDAAVAEIKKRSPTDIIPDIVFFHWESGPAMEMPSRFWEIEWV